MRFALVSDLHGNLQAWNAVLLDARSSQVDAILCLGDIVGYGPQPREVLESVHQHARYIVLGNHDAALCGLLDPGMFNETAQAALRWSREKLNDAAVQFLKSLPLVLAGPGFRCTHGEFSEPAWFQYVTNAAEAEPSWKAASEPLLFVGHTHRPALFVTGASGRTHEVEPADFVLEAGKRYLVNVGAVGQPRDGDTRASYCLYDTADASVRWRRVPFDLDAFRAAVQAAGLPEAVTAFTRHDPRSGEAPVRERLDFRPARHRDEAATGAVPMRDMDELRRSVRRWRVGFVLLALLALAAASAVAAWAWREHQRPLVLADPLGWTADARRAEGEVNLLPEFTPAAVHTRLPNWSVHLADRHAQAVSAEGRPGVVALQSSRSDLPLSVRSGRVRIAPGQRFQVSGLFEKSGDFTGSVALAVAVYREGGERLDPFAIKAPNLPRRGGWLLAQQTFEAPSQSTELDVRVEGRFHGVVRVAELRLLPRP